MSVDDDLTPGQPGVAVGTADFKPAGGVHVIGDFAAAQFRGDHLLDHLADQRFEPFDRHVRRMLVGDDHGFDRDRLPVPVTDRDLAFRVGTQIAVPHRIRMTQPGQLFDDFVRVVDRRRHQLRRLVRRVPEHHALIAGALFEKAALSLCHPLRNVRRLAMDADHHLGVVGAESDSGLVVADPPDRIEGHLLPVDFGAGGDFAGNDHQVGGRQRLAGDPAFGILGETGVENRVGNLVADLVGMALRDRFRSEDVFCTDFAHINQLLVVSAVR